MYIFHQQHHCAVSLAIRFIRRRLLSLSNSTPLMFSENKPFLQPVSYFPTASKTPTLACEDTLGASKPDAEEDLSRHTWPRERRAEFPSTIRRTLSALSITSKIQEIPDRPGPTARSHASVESLAPIKPLGTLRREHTDANLAMPPPMTGSSGCTMAEARELFQQHGIDRPAG